MSILEAFAKAVLAAAFHDKGMMKCVLNWMLKLPKEAVVDDNVYTYKVTQSTLDLWEKIEQDVATWNSSEATNNEGD